MATPRSSTSSGDTAVLGSRRLSLSALGNGPRTYRRPSRTMLSEGTPDTVHQPSTTSSVTLLPSSILLQQQPRRVSLDSAASPSPSPSSSTLLSATSSSLFSFPARRSDSVSDIKEFSTDVDTSELEDPFPVPSYHSSRLYGRKSSSDQTSVSVTSAGSREASSSFVPLTSPHLHSNSAANASAQSFSGSDRRRGSYSDMSTLQPDVFTSRETTGEMAASKPSLNSPERPASPTESVDTNTNGGRVRRKSKFMSKFASRHLENEESTPPNQDTRTGRDNSWSSSQATVRSNVGSRAIDSVPKQSTHTQSLTNQMHNESSGNPGVPTRIRTDGALRRPDTLIHKDSDDSRAYPANSGHEEGTRSPNNSHSQPEVPPANTTGGTYTYNEAVNKLANSLLSTPNPSSKFIQNDTLSRGEKAVVLFESSQTRQKDRDGSDLREVFVPDMETTVTVKPLNEGRRLPVIKPTSTNTSHGRSPLTFLARRPSADTVDASILQFLKPLTSPVSSQSALQSNVEPEVSEFPSSRFKKQRRPSPSFFPRRASEPASNLESDLAAFKRHVLDLGESPSHDHQSLPNRRQGSSPLSPSHATPGSTRRNSLTHQFLSDGPPSVAPVLKNKGDPLSRAGSGDVDKIAGVTRHSSAGISSVGGDKARDTSIDKSIDFTKTRDLSVEPEMKSGHFNLHPSHSMDIHAAETLVEEPQWDTDDTHDEVTSENSLKINQLQKQLSSTEDPDTRHRIRDLIRRLRRDPDPERLKSTHSSKPFYASSSDPHSQNATVSRSQSFTSAAERNHAFLSSLAKVPPKTHAALTQDIEAPRGQSQVDTSGQAFRTSESFQLSSAPNSNIRINASNNNALDEKGVKNYLTSLSDNGKNSLQSSPAQNSINGKNVTDNGYVEYKKSSEISEAKPLSNQNDSYTYPVSQEASSTSSVLDRAKAKLNSISLGQRYVDNTEKRSSSRKGIDPDNQRSNINDFQPFRQSSKLSTDSSSSSSVSSNELHPVKRDKVQTESVTSKYRALRKHILHDHQGNVVVPLARSSPVDEHSTLPTSHNETVEDSKKGLKIDYQQAAEKSNVENRSSETKVSVLPDSPKRSPTQGPHSPTQGPHSPTQGPHSPTQGPHSPTQGPHSPTQGPHSPTRGPHSPTRGPHSPTRGPHSPTRGPHSPTQGPHSPTQGPHSPTQGPHSPTRGPHSPTRGPHSPTRGPHSPTPGPHSPTPGPHSPTPGPHSPTPGPHSRIPVPLKRSPSPKLKRHDAFLIAPDSPRSPSYVRPRIPSVESLGSPISDKADSSQSNTQCLEFDNFRSAPLSDSPKDSLQQEKLSSYVITGKPLLKSGSEFSFLLSPGKSSPLTTHQHHRATPLSSSSLSSGNVFQYDEDVKPVTSRYSSSSVESGLSKLKPDPGKDSTASRSFVSSLTAKFSQFREDLDREESKLKSLGLRRTASLNSKVKGSLKPEEGKPFAFSSSAGTSPYVEKTNSTDVKDDKIHQPQILQPKQSVKTQSLLKDLKPVKAAKEDNTSNTIVDASVSEEKVSVADGKDSYFTDVERPASDNHIPAVKSESFPVNSADSSSFKENTEAERPTSDNLKIAVNSESSPVDSADRGASKDHEIGKEIVDRDSKVIDRESKAEVSVPEIESHSTESVTAEAPIERKISELDFQIKPPRQRKIGVIHVGGLPPTPIIDTSQTNSVNSDIRNEPQVKDDSKNDVYDDDDKKISSHKSDRNISEEITVPSQYPGLKAKPDADSSNVKHTSRLFVDPARSKRFSTPVFGSFQDRRQAVTSSIDDKPEAQRRKSENHDRQPAQTMEEAFSSLLDDLDKVTGSDENASGSDVDFSDGDDLLASSGGSNDFVDNAEIKTATKVDKNILSAENVNKDTKASSGVQKKVFQKAPPSSEPNITTSKKATTHRSVKDLRSDEDMSSMLVEESNEDNDDDDYDDDEKDATISSLSPRVQASSSTDSWSKEDSGIGLGLDDSPQSTSKEDFRKRGFFHSLSSPGPTSSVTPSKEVDIEGHQVKVMESNSFPQDAVEVNEEAMTMDTKYPDRNQNPTRPTRSHKLPNRDQLDNHNNHHHVITNDNHHSSPYSNGTKDVDAAFNSNNNNSLNTAKNAAFGSRSIEVSEDADGTYTVRAEADEGNQNRAITVRTKTVRTLSNAKEEHRDTVVEKNVVSPGGSVVQERDIVHTRKRLTHRGSNYYHRTAYTTTKHLDQQGGETTMYNVQVEDENRSVSQGQCWGDKVTTRMLLDETASGNAIMAPGSENDGDDKTVVDMKKAIPEVRQALKDVTVTEGKAVALECLVLAQPPPEVTWLKDGEPLAESDDYVLRFEEDAGKATLLIASSTLFDTATFTCRCHNDVGQAETKCRVLVKPRPVKPPEFVRDLADLEVTEGHSITLVCEVRNAASVAWYKDGIVQRNSSDFKQTFDGREARLEIGEVFLDDIGQYACVAKNEVGEQRSSCKLSVNACGSETTVVPMFLTKLPNRDVSDGETLTLECDVIGSPEPTITWLRKGEVIADTVSCSASYDGRVARLEVPCLHPGDAGVYTCVADNPAGKVSMDSNVTVTVRNKAPYFQSTLENLTVKVRKNAMLKCQVTGSPPPAILWRKNGMLIGSAKNTIQSFTGGVARLEIMGVTSQDEGQYECVAKNVVSEVSSSGQLCVDDPKATTKQDNTTTSTEDPPLPKVKRRTFKKLSEPRPADIISSVLRRATSSPTGNLGVQRAQSFSPSSSTSSSSPLSPPASLAFQASPLASSNDNSPTSAHSASSTSLTSVNADIDHNTKPQNLVHSEIITQTTPSSSDANSATNVTAASPQRPETLSVTRNSFSIISPRKSLPSSPFSPSPVSTPHLPQASEKPKPSQPQPPSAPASKPSVGVARSASMHVLRSNKRSPNLSPVAPPQQCDSLNITFSSRAVEDQQGEVTTTNNARTSSTELSPSARIPGYRPVSPMFLNSPRTENKELTGSSSSLSGNNTDDASGRIIQTPFSKDSAVDSNGQFPQSSGRSSSPVALRSQPKAAVIEQNDFKRRDSVKKQTGSSFSSSPTSSLPSTPKTPSGLSSSSSSSSSSTGQLNRIGGQSDTEDRGKPSDPSPQPKTSVGKLVSPRVSQLRQQFLQNDQLAAQQKEQQAKTLGGAKGGGGVRRWHSLPPRDVKPTVVKRESGLSSDSGQPPAHTMPSYDQINNEEELHKLMNNTEDFEERKKIRARLREIRDKQRDEYEAKRKERETAHEDEVKKRFEKAEEEKRKKMEAYKNQAPTHERDSRYHMATQSLIEDKKRLADEEKARKLAAYSQIAESKTGPGGAKINTTTTKTATSQSLAGGGTRTTMQKTTETTVSQKPGFGGVSYGKPAEETARNISQKLLQTVESGTSGHMTVKTESWNSSDNVVNKTEKTQSWGAKPQGPKGAMAAFKQMDNAANPTPAKPNGLLAVSMAKRAANTMRRNAVAIKQEILNFCKMNTAEYEGVEVTNFSSSWNNGMAFCALIHHFFPDAFDFSQLEPKKRRYNFTLAFDTAEQKADIAPLLDVDDMVKMKNPDWKCVFTYVQSIYRHLRDHENNKVMPCPVASPEQ